MENITLTQIDKKLKYLQTDLGVLESLINVTFTAAASNLSSVDEFVGTLQLLSNQTHKICEDFASLRDELQQEGSNEKNA